MNKPIFLISFLLILSVLINQAQGITVLNSRYSSGLSAGEQDAFVMTLKSDTPAEEGIPLMVSMDSGTCSEWVKLDTKEVLLTSTGTPVTASITVPKNAVNGYHLCYAEFTAPSGGMIQSQLGVPFSINTSGGVVAPITEAPTVISTPLPSNVPEMKAPLQEIPVPDYIPDMPFTFYGVIGAGCLSVLFAVVIIYDGMRSKRKVKK